MATAGAAVCGHNDFSLYLTIGDVEATLEIHPDDKSQRVLPNSIFQGRFTYRVGRPTVLDIPFVAEIVFPNNPARPPTVEIISITPEKPNVDAPADEEQQGVLQARVIPPAADPEQSGSQAKGYLVDIYISMTQPEVGQIKSIATQHSGADGDVPNVVSSDNGSTLEVTWDKPTDDQGNEVDVDIEVEIIQETEDGTEVIARRQEVDYDPNIYNIDYDYLESMLEAVPGQTKPNILSILAGYLTIVFKVKPATPGTAFNRDSVEVRVGWPFRSVVPRTALNLRARFLAHESLDLILLDWDMPELTQPPITDWNVRYKLAAADDSAYTRWFAKLSPLPDAVIGDPNDPFTPTNPLVPDTLYTFQIRSVAQVIEGDPNTRIYGDIEQVTFRSTEPQNT